MENIIKAAVDRGASDLHIKAGDVFRARIDGRLVPLTKQALTPEQTKAIALKLIQNEDVKAGIDRLLDYDCGWGAAGIGRFRVNILRQRSSFAIVMRVIPFEVPTFDELRLPPVLARISAAERGMVLVTGVTGSGKSSTMAALVNHVNESANKHIVTLENPIEFLHRDKQSSVTQREVGVDTESFAIGLRAALRQDPDVVMIGEMRDVETISTALKAAETGHLLISTLHTPDAHTTITRILAMFPPEEQDIVRIRIAESLSAVVSQRLLPRKDGQGRVVACEIMVATPTIRDLILDSSRTGEIPDYVAAGRDQYGMQTFDQHLAELVSTGQVAFEVALAAASRPSDFELNFRTLRRASREVPAHPTPAATAATPPASGTTPAAGVAPAPAPQPAGAGAADSGVVSGMSMGFDFLNGG
jgi:twitching motility protein PilT